MEPFNDVVCSLLEVPFLHWKNADKKDLVLTGRPVPLLNLSTVKSVPGRSYQKRFHAHWYQDNRWLCGSRYLQRLFCWPCLLFDGRPGRRFNRTGFVDMLNVTRGFQRHSETVDHLASALRLRKLEARHNGGGGAVTSLTRLQQKRHNDNVGMNRAVMRLFVEAVLYLSKQEPHFVDNERVSFLNRENFDRLMDTFLSISSLEMKMQYAKIKDALYEETVVENEMVKCISGYISDYVTEEMSSVGFYSIQVDEVTNSGEDAQCAITVRYVRSNGEVVQRFLGLHEVSSDDGALFYLLDGVLGPLGYGSKLVAHCYDGACVTPDTLSIVEAAVKGEAPHAVLVQSASYSFNWVLRQSLNRVPKCRLFFAKLDGFSAFFDRPASLTEERVRTAVARGRPHFMHLDALADCWGDLKDHLQGTLHDPHADPALVRQCAAFVNDMHDLDFVFALSAVHEIFEATHTLDRVLTSDNPSQVELVRAAIENKKNEDHVRQVFFKSQAKIHFMETKEEYDNLFYDDLFQTYKALFHDIADCALREIHARFTSVEKLTFLRLTDSSKFAQFSSNFPGDLLSAAVDTYPTIFKNPHRLKNELDLLYREESYRDQGVHTLTRRIVEANLNADVFQEVYRLLTLALTMPFVALGDNRTCCFETLRNYTRNSISPPLDNLVIQKDLLCELVDRFPFYDDIIDRYSAQNKRGIDLIYKNFRTEMQASKPPNSE